MSIYNNRNIYMGNLGSDPEEKDVNGKTLAKFSIAVKRSAKKDDDKVDWIPCGAWHDLARGILANYSKGDAVIVTGSLQVDTKEENGSKRTFYNVNVNTISKQTFGIKKESGGEAGESDPF